MLQYVTLGKVTLHYIALHSYLKLLFKTSTISSVKIGDQSFVQNLASFLDADSVISSFRSIEASQCPVECFGRVPRSCPNRGPSVKIDWLRSVFFLTHIYTKIHEKLSGKGQQGNFAWRMYHKRTTVCSERFNLPHVDICLTPGTSAHAKANEKLIKRKPRMADQVPTSLAVSWSVEVLLGHWF